jgi:ATP-dependent Clp protease ATP-binding subunit ClpC
MEDRVMFEKYTEKARRVIFFARYEASQFGSPNIETEHFLLGLLREDKALMNRLLRSAEAMQDIRKEIERCSDVREKIETSVDLPVSNECRRVLAYATEESERLAHQHIGTEHLLLGLLREEKCFAAKLLHDRNVRLDQVREQARQSGLEEQARQPGAAHPSVRLSEFGIDLTRQALDGILPPLVGRERELQRTIQVLCCLTRRNPVLVGEPGVGKQAIIYGLALRISEGAVPELDGRTILSLDLAVIASGTKSRSRFEDNMESILRGLLYVEYRLILFIDGLHSLANTQRFLSVANVIKPALLNARIQCISTATPAEFAKTVEASPWLEEHFAVVEVKPPSEAEAIEVLMGVKERFQKFHDVIYTDEAVQYAVFHSNSYVPNRCLPEKAIDLLDEAGARLKLRQGHLPAEVVEVNKRMRFLQQRHDGAVSNHEFEKARFYADEVRKEKDNVEALRKKYNLSQQSSATVTREDIEQIVVERTGLSIDFLRKSQANRPDFDKKQ